MTISDINRVISIVPNVVKFICAKKDDIEICTQSLLGLKRIYIPDEYIEFLTTISNGLSVDGICLFGTIDQKYKMYSFVSLVTINNQFIDINFVKKYLIIGQFFNLYIVYNYDTHSYEIVNLISFTPISIYTSFEMLFYELLIKRNE